MPFTSGPKTQNTQESGRYRLSKRDIFGPYLCYVWQILLLDRSYLAYIWHFFFGKGLFGGMFLGFSPPATAIYKRDTSGQTSESAIYKRDIRKI